MGYSYTVGTKTVKGGQLCCDLCGSYPAKKIKCPYDWCQPYAVCAECKKKVNIKDEKYHKHCNESAAEYDRKKQEKQMLLSQGLFLRCAALTTDDNSVKVCFRNKVNEEKTFIMSKENYDSYPINQNTVIEDYSKNEVLHECEW